MRSASVLLAVLIFLAVSSWSRQPAVGARPRCSRSTSRTTCTCRRTRSTASTATPTRAARSTPGCRRWTRCMGCHKITAADKPEIKKLAEYAAKQRADPVGAGVQGAGVHVLPAQGARAGRASRCQTCHGPVETMTTVGRDTGPAPRQRPAQPGRASAGAAAADDGLVHRLPPRAERDARHEGAARLRRRATTDGRDRRTGMNRRDFFKIVATSGATAAAAGCQQATEKILPLVVPNEQLVPGVAVVVRHRVPRVPGRLRRPRAQPRRAAWSSSRAIPTIPSTAARSARAARRALQGLYHPDRFAGPQRREGDALQAASAGTTRSSCSPSKLGRARGRQGPGGRAS